MQSNVKSHNMKLALAALLAAALGAYVVSPEPARAAIGAGNIFSYQGRLTDTSGNPAADGAHCFRFSIYDAQSAGTKLWPSATPSAMAATTTSGVFNIGIGDTGAGGDDLSLFSSVNDNAKYLNVEAGNQVSGSCAGASFETLAPRQRFESVPTAYELYGGDARIGTGAGTASGQKLLKLDVKSVADTVGATACSPNGALWYNSGNARTLVCNNNLYQVVGSSITNQFFDVAGPTTTGGIKTFTFPDASATVLTTNAAVTAAQGGTGQTSYTIGDILYSSGATALSKLADVAAGSYLRSGGVSTAPVWSTMTLPNTAAQGDILYSSGANIISTLAKDTNATRYLSNTGASNSPAWAQVNLANGVTGTIGTANLGSGTANSSTYLRGDQTWAAVSGGTNALLDGVSHTDTTAGTVVRGDLITGQTATPKWTRLAKGTANQVLSMDASGVDVVWATPTGGGTPGGANTQIQFNNAGAFGGSANLTFNSATNDLTFSGTDPNIYLGAITNEPAVPGAGTVVLYAKSIAGRVMPKWMGPAGIDVPAQPHVGFDKIGWWNPPGGATTVPGVLGFTAPTAVGTATTRSVAATNLFTRTRRLGYVSSSVAGNLAGHYNAAAATVYTVGTGTGLGGFFYVVRFGTSDAATVAGARQFVGLTSTTAAPTNVEPSTLINSIGVGHGASDTNLKIFYGGSAAQTPIDLGANFPANTLSVDMYELVLFAAPNSNNTVGYRITRLNTGNIAEGTLTAATPGTQLPASTTFLGHRAWRTNNATALAVGIDVASVYISTDY